MNAPTPASPTDISLVYVADVMCSWCWGFAPTVERLHRELGLEVLVVNGGLRPGDSAEEMTPKMTTFLEGCWRDVGKASGQPFDRAGLRKPAGWRYDTEPPARAVATLRDQDPHAAMTLFHRLQEAFYSKAIDVVSPATWGPMLIDLVDDVDAFVARAMGDEGKALAWRDFSQARSWGISGFPCLLLRSGEELMLVTRGWAPDAAVVDGVRTFLAERALTAADGEACAVDGSGC
ncbi:MAG: DsbA family protein [Deltaproteobacteria bacterium]|nr:DsbA family protein [Deltaproteobacteria bacterium]